MKIKKMSAKVDFEKMTGQRIADLVMTGQICAIWLYWYGMDLPLNATIAAVDFETVNPGKLFNVQRQGVLLRIISQSTPTIGL